MWSVNRPAMDAGEVFSTCISKVRNRALRESLREVKPSVEAAAHDYAVKADDSELHLLPQHSVIGTLSGTELVKTYESRMVNKTGPGRPIYDQLRLLPEGNRCPYCDHRNVSTLDHVLPKEDYPVFAVTPDNLVGACAECNLVKASVIPTTGSENLIHPYFDELGEYQWLRAEVIEETPAAVVFFTQLREEWSDELNDRVSNQFALFQLAELYASQAAREIADIRHNLLRHYETGGLVAVRDELSYQRESRERNRINSWQTATYQALEESDWFCDGGFASM